ncbi:MAG: sulfotransferase family protein [Actinomycetes bacterium]
MANDRPIFVVGCPRSGTTMLGLMIHAHPRLAMPPESRFLIKTWRRRHAFGDLQTDEQRTALADEITRPGSMITELGFRKQQLVDAILDAPPTIGSALGAVFQEYAKAHGKARWGDKRPIYFQEVDVLRRLFPDAQFIHVIRDGRANVESLKRMPWFPHSNVSAMSLWSWAETCMRRNLKRLPADTYHTIRYETLVSDPKPVLQEMCAFLGEDFHEAMLEPHKVTDIIPERKVWHANLKQGINVDRIEAWREGLEPWEIGLMETVLRRKLTRYGYQLSGDGTRPSITSLRRYSYVARHNRTEVSKRWAEEAREARHATYPVAAQLTSGQKALALP